MTEPEDTTLHFQVVGPDPVERTDEALAESAERARVRLAEVLAELDLTVEEWRVVADAGPGFPTYEFTWRGPSAEASARAFLEQPGATKALRDPTLLHRTVTTTAWTQV